MTTAAASTRPAVTLEHVLSAIDLAILQTQRWNDEDAFKHAVSLAFALAIDFGAPAAVSYCIQVADLDIGDWDGPEVLLRLAREKLLEAEGGDDA